MSKFKRAMNFTSGEVLKTTKDILTDWIFISEAHSNAITGRRYINAKCKCGREKVRNFYRNKINHNICF